MALHLLQGVKASDNALGSYCMLHRLSLALVEDYNLLPTLASSLDRFKISRTARLKSAVPSLGPFVALLSLTPSKRHSWQTMVSSIEHQGCRESCICMRRTGLIYDPLPGSSCCFIDCLQKIPEPDAAFGQGPGRCCNLLPCDLT